MADPVEQKPFVRMREFRSIYSNAFRLRAGDNDTSIIFGFETEDQSSQEVIADEVEVILTPRSLKLLHLIIGRAIEEVESLGGAIIVPKAITDAIQTKTKVRAAAKQQS